MPSTAEEMVAAARINFGKPRDDRGMELMRRWLNTGARDWRRETDGVAADEVVVSVVFAEAMKAQHLRMQLANNVKRWGFVRKEHAKTNLRFLSIEEYMEGGTGELVRTRVRNVLQGAVGKFQKKKMKRQVSEEELARRLAAFREKQRKKCVPELRLALKGFWTSVEMDCGIKQKEKGWHSFRDDPVVKRRRLTRGVEFERIDEFKEDGEPDFAAQERKRRLRATMQV
jgi:hypothetical protein